MLTKTYTSNDIFKLRVILVCKNNAKHQPVKSFPYITNNSIFWYIHVCQSLSEAIHHSFISYNNQIHLLR